MTLYSSVYPRNLKTVIAVYYFPCPMMVTPEKKAETMWDKKCGMMPEKYPSYFSMVTTTMMHRFSLEMVIVIYSWAIAIEGVLSKAIN